MRGLEKSKSPILRVYIVFVQTLKKVKFNITIALFVLCLIVPSSIDAQSNRGKEAVAAQKALYFYSFATGCDWPDEFRSGNFVIGIYGDNELYSRLVEKLSSSKRGIQPFEIIEFKKASEIKECHILYVDETKKDVLPSKRKALRSSATLIITNEKGILDAGSMINFVYPSTLTMFEVSKTNASKSKLVIGKPISSLAVAVR